MWPVCRVDGAILKKCPGKGACKVLIATTDLKTMLDETNIIFISVATPTSDEGYDHSQVAKVLDSIASFGKQPLRKHLVVACTTIPGYCDQVAAKVAPYNISLSYNPEFIAQGSIIHDQQYPDQVLIGEADKNLEVAKKYNVPLNKGVPAVAVVISDGTLAYSSANGEFEAARTMMRKDLVAFLKHWREKK